MNRPALERLRTRGTSGYATRHELVALLDALLAPEPAPDPDAGRIFYRADPLAPPGAIYGVCTDTWRVTNDGVTWHTYPPPAARHENWSA